MNRKLITGPQGADGVSASRREIVARLRAPLALRVHIDRALLGEIHHASSAQRRFLRLAGWACLADSDVA